MNILTPIFGIAFDLCDNCEMYGQIPGEYDCVLEGLCSGLEVKYDSVLVDRRFGLVRFLIKDLDPTSESAVRGFLSGLKAVEYDVPDALVLMHTVVTV